MQRLVSIGVLVAALVALAVSPAAAAEPNNAALVTASVLNVRGGPGTNYSVLTQTTYGTSLEVLGQNATGDWLQIQTPDGISGWVASRYTSPTTIEQPAADGSPTRIVAPAIGLDARVVPAGWHEVRSADGSVSAEWDVPAYSAGWLITSVKPGQLGNMVLSGHHNIYGQVFRYVVNLQPGNEITIYAGSQAFHYRVTDKFILADKYVSYEQRLKNASWIGSFPDERLTLVTCWPYTNNTHRVIVIAKPAQ